MDGIREGDVILVSGPVGDHGIAVMLAREEFELSGKVASDCAAVTPFHGAARRDGRRALHARPHARWPRHGGA